MKQIVTAVVAKVAVAAAAVNSVGTRRIPTVIKYEPQPAQHRLLSDRLLQDDASNTVSIGGTAFFDINGNGYLSLAEVTKGVRDVIAVDELFDAIPAINRSFHHVKAVSKAENSHGDDFIQFSEFRLLLQTLRQFFEYYEAFNRLDTGEDQRVDKEEFTSDKMKEVIEKVTRHKQVSGSGASNFGSLSVGWTN